MLVALREACMLSEYDASLWTLYGARLAEFGQAEEARKALVHAQWLRRSAGDRRRAAVVEALLERLAIAA
jgi:Flp pilus assembly protein TadD